MKTITLKIVGMHCSSCAINIDGELEDTDGVTEANTNYAKAETTVTYEEGKISPEKLITIIKTLDYDVAQEG
ncbi:heavy-metal-associated domain-containing protein [Candidatus Gottesmanbacteria bacterium]|nr:heavy-metal-associated domain-containing protein [Candidatus Gottesmanbacteria bacterium]